LKSLVTIVTRAALAGTVSAVGMGAASALSASVAPSLFPPPGQAAVFVQTDNPAGNQIVAYERAPNGALGDPQAYNTGGNGAVTSGSAVDPLASQGSLVLANGGRSLLAVNAGSDTVSVFRVFGSRLVLSQVVASGGEFPASIAVHGDLVYVLNSGGAGSVQGFSFFGGRLIPLWGSNRSLGLSNMSPPFFLDSPGQVGFTPDGQQLIVTTKNSGSDIDVYSVGEFGYLSGQPTVNAAAAPVPFAFTFDAVGNLIVTEAGSSDLASYSVASNGTVTKIGSAGDGQAALCWVTAVDGYFYGSNAGSANVSQFGETSDGVPNLVGVAASLSSGATDSAASSDGRYLYVEEGGIGTVAEFQVASAGALAQIGQVSELSAPLEGIAAS
jgi:6-phosphogluconolactonase (cycloisomerase 2 family)